jgi:gamma-butyrobetaine dioxygenase
MNHPLSAIMTTISSNPPPTPDFYLYPPAPIQRTEISPEGDWVTLFWEDDSVLACYYLWLQENDVDQGGIDRATREGLLDPAELVLERTIHNAFVDESGHLCVEWRKGPLSHFNSGWLKTLAAGQHRAGAFIPLSIPWRRADLEAPPKHCAKRVQSDAHAMAAWLNDLARYGVTLLDNAPTQSEFLLNFAESIGPIRDSNFGRLWDVHADQALAGEAETNSTANTGLRLGPHADLPTRQLPPAFQFLHCLRNEAVGGASTLCDSLAIIEHLKAYQPDDLKQLTSSRWIFFNRGPGLDHRWSGPIIDFSGAGRNPVIRAFYPVKAFPDMPQKEVPSAYQALKRFQQLAASDQFELRLTLQPGQILCFDNHRILHGRDAFAAQGVRHLQGIYIDRDEIDCRTRVANRLADHSPAPSKER